MEKAYPTKKSVIEFACNGEAILSDALTLFASISSRILSLGGTKGVSIRFDKQNACTYLGTFKVVP